MARLLVSVRSAGEALAALEGGASVIDVKEPSRGPLGRADQATWTAVRGVLHSAVPLSVALGELHEFVEQSTPGEPTRLSQLNVGAFEGVTYRKLGLHRAGRDPAWREHWRQVQQRLGKGPAWIAVSYADHALAQAPDPDEVFAAALELGCAGVLVDTWSKTSRRRWFEEPGWSRWSDKVRAQGLTLAVAGGLDETSIVRALKLSPDLIAVRGAACLRGNRNDSIDVQRVRRLVHLLAETNSG